MTVSNDTIQSNLVQVWCLELEHLMNTCSVDLVAGLGDLLGSIIRATKARIDNLLSILVQQVERGQMCTRRDLDQLCKAVPNLCLWQSAEEGEVEEGVDRRMVCSQTILVVAVVHGDLD